MIFLPSITLILFWESKYSYCVRTLKNSTFSSSFFPTLLTCFKLIFSVYLYVAEIQTKLRFCSIDSFHQLLLGLCIHYTPIGTTLDTVKLMKNGFQMDLLHYNMNKSQQHLIKYILHTYRARKCLHKSARWVEVFFLMTVH